MGYIGGLRSFDGDEREYHMKMMMALEEASEEVPDDIIDDDSRRYDYYTGKLLDRTKYIAGRDKELQQMEDFSVVRRVKKSEATNGKHVRMKIIASEKGDIVRWRLVSMEVNNHERPDVFAGTPSLKVFRMLIAKAASHRHPEHGHRKIIAILDAAVAFFHAEMDETIYAHPPREAEADPTVVWLLLKARYGTRKAARLWQEFLRNEVFLTANWECVAVEPNVYHKNGKDNDDDDASACVHGDDFTIEARYDVFQESFDMIKSKVDIKVISIIGPGQSTEAKIVKRVLNWCPGGFSWKANPQHAIDLIKWAGLENSAAAAPSPGTQATTKSMRDALDELPYERAGPASSAGGTATYLALDRSDISYSVRRANQDISKPKA